MPTTKKPPINPGKMEESAFDARDADQGSLKEIVQHKPEQIPNKNNATRVPDANKESSRENTKNCANLKYYFLRSVLVVPAVVDGIGYSALSFAQILITLYGLRLMKANPALLKKARRLEPILLPSAIAGIGVAGLGLFENKKRTEEILGHSIEENISQMTVKDRIKQHPVEIFCIIVAAAVDGIVVVANSAYIANQFGYYFKDSPFYYPGITVASLTTVQSLLLNGPAIFRLVEEGYVFPNGFDYTQRFHHPFVKGVIKAGVNILPILAAITIGALGASEAYQLTQYITQLFEKEDIANRVAWLPAFVMGLIFSVANLSFIASNQAPPVSPPSNREVDEHSRLLPGRSHSTSGINGYGLNYVV